MKTLVIVYVLTFISVVVLCLCRHNYLVSARHSRVSEGKSGHRQVNCEAICRETSPEPPPGSTAGRSAVNAEPIAVPFDKGAGEAAPVTGVDGEELPLTIEGIEESMAMLTVLAKTEPEVNIDIAQHCYRKAQIYRARILELWERMLGAGPEKRPELSQRQAQVERRKIQALMDAKKALDKLPRNTYGDTDVRLMKALICFDLPGQEVMGLAELRKIVEDPRARPFIRSRCREMLNMYAPLMEK